MTSRDVVNCVQRLLRFRTGSADKNSIAGANRDVESLAPSPPERSVPSRAIKLGHTGTLDPMATGVLLIVAGSATRMVEYAHLLPKTYEAEFVLGVTSDTLDSTGTIQELPNARAILRGSIIAELAKWHGSIQQRPPKYSAVHVEGRRAYQLARRGSDFELPLRKVFIHSLELLDYEYPKYTLRVRCSTGTYIRSLGADIAIALGSSAIMSRLVRTQIGPFHLANCVNLVDLRSSRDIQEALLPPLGLLQDITKLQLDEQSCSKLRQGKMLEWDNPLQAENLSGAELAVIDLQDRPVAIVKLLHGLLRPVRVFNY